MHEARWSAMACIVALLGCSADPDAIVGGGKDLNDDKSPSKTVDAGTGGKRDASTSPTRPRDDDDDDDEPAAPIPSSGKDAGDENCGHDSLHTQTKTPDILIVLDRSGSMRPDARTANLRCDNLDPIADIGRGLECALAGINCNNPRDQMTVNCGGTQMRSVDRWAPSVGAIKKLTNDFNSDIAFGLITFPGQGSGGRGGNGCTPGTLQVPIGTNKAAEIARVLDGTQPGGGTPTGQALQTALSEFMKSSTADVAPPPRYVVLVTDGQPTCPNAQGGGGGGANAVAADKQLTLDALDALRKADIKTYVIGYDAALDPQFSMSLTEFAQHGGTDRYYPVQDEASLAQAFSTISSAVIPCEAKITSTVIGPEYVHVTLDEKQELEFEHPDGWRLEGDMVIIQGAACQTLQMGKGHKVDVVVDCMRIE